MDVSKFANNYLIVISFFSFDRKKKKNRRYEDAFEHVAFGDLDQCRRTGRHYQSTVIISFSSSWTGDGLQLAKISSDVHNGSSFASQDREKRNNLINELANEWYPKLINKVEIKWKKFLLFKNKA